MTKVNYISIAKKAASIQIAELKKINKIFNKNMTGCGHTVLKFLINHLYKLLI